MTVRRLLTAGSVLYCIGFLIRQAKLSVDPAFATAGLGELWVHAPMWAGATIVAGAGAWGAARDRSRLGYLSVLGAALANLGAEAWHTWAHYHHQDYRAAHVALAVTAGWGVAAVAVVLIGNRRRERRPSELSVDLVTRARLR